MKFNKLALMFVILGVVFFMNGIHTIDAAWNLQYIEAKTHTQYLDLNYFGNGFEKAELYRQGIMVTFAGFLLALMGALYLSRTEAYIKRERNR